MKAIILFLFLGGGISLAYVEDNSLPSSTIILSDKKLGSAGKDYQALLALLNQYPRAYSQSFIATEKLLTQHKGNQKQSRFYSRRFSSALEQRRRLEKVLEGFKEAYKAWRDQIQQKLAFGLYGPQKRAFYLKIIEYCNQVVNHQPLPYQLLALHHLRDQIKVPLYDGLSFEQRFLKPKYAERYRQQKIAFYASMIHKLEGTSHNKSVSTQQLLNFYTQKKKKWENRQISAESKLLKSFPLDDLLGITTLQSMGYKGRGVKVGVIESIPLKGNPLSVHADLKKNLIIHDRLISKHGAHVAGIIAARAQTVSDRLGVAPKAKVFYIPLPTTTQGAVIYYQTASPSEGRSIIDSRPSPTSDQELAKALDQLRQQGIKIVNASFAFSLGPYSLKAFKQFAKAGGILIKAAGNAGVTLRDAISVEKNKLSSTQQIQTGIDSGFYAHLRKEPDLWPHVIIVGNLKEGEVLDETSNRAGNFQSRFIAAWGSQVISTTGPYNRESLSGTSMASPMITASLALLSEAFPSCSPVLLAQILLDGGAPFGDPNETGQGRLDLTRSFSLGEKICGRAKPVPL